jgi:hypothetical protein
MTVDAFFSTWNGKGADFDGWYGDQCVDLFNFYNRDVVGAPFTGTPYTGGAADLWRSYHADFYDRIDNSISFVPRKGDVMIWAANTPATGPAGHVAICTGEADTNYFVSFDQNYPTGSKCHFQRHGYTGVYGVLRPKNLNNGEPTMPASQDKVDNPTVQLEYNNALLRDASPDEIATRVNSGETVEHMQRELRDSAEHQEVQRLVGLGRDTEAKGGLSDQLKLAQATIKGLNKQLEDAKSQPVSEDQAAAVVATKANPLFDFLRLVLSKLAKKQ